MNENEKNALIIELNTLMNCDSVHIVKCKGAFFKKGNVYVAMEFMDLGTLAEIILPRKTLNEPILGQIAYQILLGLEHLHKKCHVIHRDIKPTNILINSQGHVGAVHEGQTR